MSCLIAIYHWIRDGYKRPQLGNKEKATPMSGNLTGYPNTYPHYIRESGDKTRPDIFDPSLRSFSRAFRVGDPVFSSETARADWYKTRRHVLDHLLQIVANAAQSEHLVLRGSMLLPFWLGNAAREPGDIDFVFEPSDIPPHGPVADEMFNAWIAEVARQPLAGKAHIDATRAAMDDIWTYERAQGRRIVFPYTADGEPPGQVQIDVVFGEELLIRPEIIFLPFLNGNVIGLKAATKEQSLAWKMQWLVTDSFPQGKDLYDAVLLAEQCYLPYDLLVRSIIAGDSYYAKRPIDEETITFNDIEWDDFLKEYPDVKGDAYEWAARLRKALQPTFAERNRQVE